MTDDSSPTPIRRSTSMRIVLLIGLLLVGAQLWLLSDAWLYRPLWRIAIYAGSLAICFLPVVQRLIEWLASGLAPRSFIRSSAAVFAIIVLSIAALYATAIASDRQFTPIFHDEFSYLLQSRMFASGQLWIPAHPLSDFFETFYVITDRAYASQYFPGTAILLMPGALLGLPEWMMPLVLAGAACGAMFLLMRELFNAAVGLASVFVLVGVLGFRVVSITPIATVPALLLGTIALFAILKWDRQRAWRWIVITGIAIGWLAVTRPLEGAVSGLTIAAFVAIRLRGKSLKEWRGVIVAGLVPLIPFAALQLSLNRGITGHWLQTPFNYYLERDMPGTELGFRGFDPSTRPTSHLKQKQDFYDLQVRHAVEDHTFRQAVLEWPRRRFADATLQIFPDMLLVIVIPAAIFGLASGRRRMVVAIMPAWWIAYTLHVFVFSHYFLFYISSMFVLIFSGFDGIAACLGPRGGRVARTAQVVLPVVISVMTMPQFKRDVRDQWYANPVEIAIERAIANIPESRAIVLVRYDSSAIPEQEVVYNVDVAWPDDARAIRVQDLGEDRDRELFRYFAQRQPDRVVYRFERKDLSMHRVGLVTDLAAHENALDAGATRPTIGQATTSQLISK